MHPTPDPKAAASAAPRAATSALEDFRITTPLELHALLKGLKDERVLLAIGAPGGATYVTTLVAVDPAHRRLGFAASDDDAQLQRLLDADEATAVGWLDHVKLQFDLANLMLVRSGTVATLQADLPHEMFRFQRRTSFRVRVPALSTPTVQLRHPALPDMRLALRVMDVSTGGCSLFLPEDVPLIDPGVRIQDARIELDPETRFPATLQLQHITSLNPASGGVRLGCALTDLLPEAQRALQRYVDLLQRQRRAFGE